MICRRLFTIVFVLAAFSLPAQTNLSIYSDELDNGFQDWSWGNRSLTNTSPVHSGAYSVSMNAPAWAGISFWHSAFNPAPYTNLTFWANGGTNGGQILQLYFNYGPTNASTAGYTLPALPKNSWKQFVIPFSALGAGSISNLNRINWQLTGSGTTGAFYFDDINLTAIPPSPVHLGVDVAQTIRPAEARWLGLNTAVWDSHFDTATTSNALADLGTQILRFPGGSLSDEYHWASNTSLTNTWHWATSFANFIHVATNAGVHAMITVNYGTGTSNEAAAWVRSANVTNQLGFKYWEIGNECYGSWETDSNSVPHDPYTYAVRAANYIQLMKAADPTIKIGVVAMPGEDNYVNNTNHPATNSITGQVHYGWTPVMLSTLKSLGVAPDFLVHHVYPEYGSDNDQTLLLASRNWAGDAADLRGQINAYFGAAGSNVELCVTENNADAGNQGRQSTSLVNGLFLADSLAALTRTEFNSFIWWDLRNGLDTNGDFSASLYGWRTNGDLGIIGGLNTRYPTYYTDKLMQFFVHGGDTVLKASSDYALLPAYAMRKGDGSVALLVINKDRYDGEGAQVVLTNFAPWSSAIVRSYGMAQDEAARTNGPLAAQDIATNNLAISGTNFLTTFPPYSVTLLTFPPAAPSLTLNLASTNRSVLAVRGQKVVRYVLQEATDLSGSWNSIATNTLATDTWNFTNTISAGTSARFWRAVWFPEN
ncbi:MAG TPA: alpha-L-arabinofuranosidase [Verrucomicrobiae bacterium]|nr:alpha-L-arabinofuranosidase [Verrucomicrobiae bacterium]